MNSRPVSLVLSVCLSIMAQQPVFPQSSVEAALSSQARASSAASGDLSAFSRAGSTASQADSGAAMLPPSKYDAGTKLWKRWLATPVPQKGCTEERMITLQTSTDSRNWSDSGVSVVVVGKAENSAGLSKELQRLEAAYGSVDGK